MSTPTTPSDNNPPDPSTRQGRRAAAPGTSATTGAGQTDATGRVDLEPGLADVATSGAATSGSELLIALAELQNLLLADADLTEFLRQVAVLAARVIPGSSCGITLRRDNEVATVASSDALAMEVDEIQYGTGQGPCLQSMADGVEIHVPDLTADDRWGDYRIHALTHGIRSSLSMPLIVDGAVIGALNLYADHPYAFTGPDADSSRGFARQAATALTVVLRRADQVTLEAQLRDALSSRSVIDQAIGIVMGQRRITAPNAFAVLREASQNQNRKLTDIAADLIQSFTGQPPTPPRPFIPPR